jgi:hypothetical protein
MRPSVELFMEEKMSCCFVVCVGTGDMDFEDEDESSWESGGDEGKTVSKILWFSIIIMDGGSHSLLIIILFRSQDSCYIQIGNRCRWDILKAMITLEWLTSKSNGRSKEIFNWNSRRHHTKWMRPKRSFWLEDEFQSRLSVTKDDNNAPEKRQNETRESVVSLIRSSICFCNCNFLCLYRIITIWILRCVSFKRWMRYPVHYGRWGFCVICSGFSPALNLIRIVSLVQKETKEGVLHQNKLPDIIKCIENRCNSQTGGIRSLISRQERLETKWQEIRQTRKRRVCSLKRQSQLWRSFLRGNELKTKTRDPKRLLIQNCQIFWSLLFLRPRSFYCLHVNVKECLLFK